MELDQNDMELEKIDMELAYSIYNNMEDLISPDGENDIYFELSAIVRKYMDGTKKNLKQQESFNLVLDLCE